MFWAVPSIRGGGIDSPRPASQRAAALILTAALLTGAAFPAFAGTYYIEDGDIVISAGTNNGTNKVEQGGTLKSENDKDTVITNKNTDTASSNTVTIETKNKDDKVEVTLDNVNIKADSGSALTSKGDVTLTLKGDNHLTGGNGSSGIDSIGSLTIYGGENDSLTAKGGSGADGSGGDGIHSGSLTIYGGTVNANGGNCGDGNYSDGGSGIRISSHSLTIYDGTVNAKGGNGGDGNYSDGGSGISSNGSLTIYDGTVTATGGNCGDGENSDGGSGISSFGGVTVSGGTVNATGGDGGNGNYSDGGSGVHIFRSGSLTIYGGTVNANGGKSGDGNYSDGGSGIYSGSGVAISGGTVKSNGGSGNSSGGNGIYSFDRVTISDGTVTAAGSNGKYGGNGISSSSDIDLSGSLELTAKAGSPNGKALSQDGRELDLDTIKEKLGPGAKVTTNANGETKEVSIPRPVEPEGPVIPEESSSSSGGGSAAPSAPASPLPGLTVTDKDGQRISYTSTQSGNTLTVCVGRLTASLRISLAALRQLRAEGIETITFQTILCSTTLSVDELLAMGGEDAEAVLTHRFTDSSLTVG